MSEHQCVHEGTCYPAHHVSAALADRSLAEAAAEALQRAGFADVDLFHGQTAYIAIRDLGRHANPLQRAWRRVRDIGQEGEVHRQYLATLREGGSYLIVYAGTLDQAARARAILAANGAHYIWHAGAWTVERMAET